MTGPPNRLLSSLADADIDAIRPHLETIDLPQETVLFEDGDTISRVYFPHRCVVSLVVEMEVGDMIETAMVGRDGVTNATSALDGKIALQRGIVQVAGDGFAQRTKLFFCCSKFLGVPAYNNGEDAVLYEFFCNGQANTGSAACYNCNL